MAEIRTVPNQRVIEVRKEPTDKQHLYTANNLQALDEAAARLQSIGGFKLYIYLAKNQNKYTFALSSAAFMEWSGLGKKAYTTAFEDLKKQGFLVQSEGQSNKYIFHDKPQWTEAEEEPERDRVVIEYPQDGFVF